MGILGWLVLAAGWVGVAPVQAATPTLAQRLCADPWTTVCLSADTRNETREEEVQALRLRLHDEILGQALLPTARGGCGGQPSADLLKLYQNAGRSAAEVKELAELDTLHSDPNRAICLAKLAEEKVFKHVGAVLNRQGIQQIFERVRAELQVAVVEELGADPARHALAVEMTDVLGRMQLVMADRLQEFARLNSEPQLDGTRRLNLSGIATDEGGACGPDFLARQMVSISSGYYRKDGSKSIPVHTGLLALVACPGQWLDLLLVKNSAPEESLLQVMGHELAHQIQPTRNRPSDGTLLENGTPMTFNASPAYAGYLACVNRAYAPPVLPAVSSGFRESPQAAIVARQLGQAINGVNSRINEIASDQWGLRVMQRLLTRLRQNPEERAWGVVNSMRRLCRVASTRALFTSHTDSHPSGRFRIENSVRNPAFRAALGCAGTTVPGTEQPELAYCPF